MKRVSLGIESLKGELARWKKSHKRKPRVGILCHPSSATRQFEHLKSIVEDSAELVCSFGPQHGIYGETQDNMIEWQDHRDEAGRPIYSLYGERRIPTPQSLANLDLVICDLFDVGARYYTFIYTLYYMMNVCGSLRIPVWICDRPNPLGGKLVEGNILNTEYKSFVGLHPIPVCHGMTVGELAQFFLQFCSPIPEIKILKMKSWSRSMLWKDTGLTWTLPSPNMPNDQAALVYPGMCLLEGTSLSEGRGTTRPFELIGAPFFDWEQIESIYSQQAKKLGLCPVIFHRQGFIPTFHKFKDQVCRGALQFVPKPPAFKPLRHMTVLLWTFKKLYPNQWQWKQPPYEYEYTKLPIDILAGGVELRLTVDEQRPLKDLFRSWQYDEAAFVKARQPYLLY